MWSEWKPAFANRKPISNIPFSPLSILSLEWKGELFWTLVIWLPESLNKRHLKTVLFLLPRVYRWGFLLFLEFKTFYFCFCHWFMTAISCKHLRRQNPELSRHLSCEGEKEINVFRFSFLSALVTSFLWYLFIEFCTWLKCIDVLCQSQSRKKN